MHNHAPKQCPRCKSEFICKSDDISECQCYGVTLSPNTREYLSKIQNYSCYCSGCLKEIEEMVQSAEKLPFPERKGEFIEGLHYYMNGNFWVFKEFYHIQRGYCCENNCKHCAYGRKQLISNK